MAIKRSQRSPRAWRHYEIGLGVKWCPADPDNASARKPKPIRWDEFAPCLPYVRRLRGPLLVLTKSRDGIVVVITADGRLEEKSLHGVGCWPALPVTPAQLDKLSEIAGRAIAWQAFVEMRRRFAP